MPTTKRRFGTTTTIVFKVALVHFLLTFLISGIGWHYLYGWDSPHWLRALWASMFDLPLMIVLQSFVWPTPACILIIGLLNSLFFSWLIVMPLRKIWEFSKTKRKHDLMVASLCFLTTISLLGVIGARWIPPNIISAREACIANLRTIETATPR